MSFRIKNYIAIGVCIILLVMSLCKRLHGSDSHRNISPTRVSSTRAGSPQIGLQQISSIAIREPFQVSSGSNSSEDNGSYPLAGSPEQEAEDDILTEAAINSAPSYLSSKLGDLKPFVKLLLRTKRSSPVHESSEILNALKRASSHQSLPFPRDESVDDDSPNERELHSSLLTRESQREHMYIQRLLLEASQRALESKEAELQERSKLLHEKERKLDERFSKKATAAIASVASLLTTLGGALAAYYSSK